jgi:predicted NUDIX family NTP pyrophosphohydrolase
MSRRSAGLLVYRRGSGGGICLLLVHMGGPFWQRKDQGAWSIPKGEYGDGEDPLAVARREFREELGQPPPTGDPVELGEFRQAGGKRVVVFAIEGDVDASDVRSNEFQMEWPPGSGQLRSFPEVDRAEWMVPELAKRRVVRGQVPAIDRLLEMTASGGGGSQA